MEGDRSDRRSCPRHALSAALGIDTAARKDRVGVTRNLSATGVLFHTASRFEVDEQVRLRFRARPLFSGEAQVTGRVVRRWLEARCDASPFPHVIAVEFDEPLRSVVRQAQ